MNINFVKYQSRGTFVQVYALRALISLYGTLDAKRFDQMSVVDDEFYTYTGEEWRMKI